MNKSYIYIYMGIYEVVTRCFHRHAINNMQVLKCHFLSQRTKKYMHSFVRFFLFCFVFVCLFFVAQGITIFKNPVAYVHPAAFQGLIRLQSLVIYSAQLHVAPSLRFIGHSLNTLDLSNSKVEFKSGYFKHGYIMQTLTVVSSDLREMPISLRMIAESLETLSLSDNSITMIWSKNPHIWQVIFDFNEKITWLVVINVCHNKNITNNIWSWPFSI